MNISREHYFFQKHILGKIYSPDISDIYVSSSTVGDVIERLSVSYPGSEIIIRNQLLELREDQRLAEVTDEGDTLTAFKQQRRSGAGSNMEEDDDLFVVILSLSLDVTKDSLL